MSKTKPVKDKVKKSAMERLDAQTVERKGSIAKKMTVSATDIRQATTANELSKLQRRIDDMPDGKRKTMMQNMLDRQVNAFEKMQASEVDRASRRSAQSNRDRKMKDKVTLPELPFNKGGYANCGASMKATQKSTNHMAYGGMARKR